MSQRRGFRRPNESMVRRQLSNIVLMGDEVKVKQCTFDIEDENGKQKQIVITEPHVRWYEFPKLKLYLVQGEDVETIDVESEAKQTVQQEDIDIIIKQTNCTEEEAKLTLQECNGDIAEAIIHIKTK